MTPQVCRDALTDRPFAPAQIDVAEPAFWVRSPRREHNGRASNCSVASTSLWPDQGGALGIGLSPGCTTGQMVVDDAQGLHRRVHGCRSDEAEPTLAEVLRQRGRLGSAGRQLGELLGRARSDRLVLPGSPSRSSTTGSGKEPYHGGRCSQECRTLVHVAGMVSCVWVVGLSPLTLQYVLSGSWRRSGDRRRGRSGSRQWCRCARRSRW